MLAPWDRNDRHMIPPSMPNGPRRWASMALFMGRILEVVKGIQHFMSVANDLSDGRSK